MDAFMVIPANVLLDRLNNDSHPSQIIHSFFEIRLRATYLQDHETLLARQDTGFQDVEAQVEIFDQPVDDGLILVFLGKMKDHLFGDHILSPFDLTKKYYTEAILSTMILIISSFEDRASPP